MRAGVGVRSRCCGVCSSPESLGWLFCVLSGCSSALAAVAPRSRGRCRSVEDRAWGRLRPITPVIATSNNRIRATKAKSAVRSLPLSTRSSRMRNTRGINSGPVLPSQHGCTVNSGGSVDGGFLGHLTTSRRVAPVSRCALVAAAALPVPHSLDRGSSWTPASPWGPLCWPPWWLCLPYLLARQSMPGSTLPSSSSSEAPPPVDTNVTLSSIPALAAAVAESCRRPPPPKNTPKSPRKKATPPPEKGQYHPWQARQSVRVSNPTPRTAQRTGRQGGREGVAMLTTRARK